MRAYGSTVALVLVAFSTAISPSCKPQSESEVQSLDNFAAQSTVRFNECSADSAGRKTAGDQPLADRMLIVGPAANLLAEPLVFQARMTLTAVPPVYQSAFRAMGGRVLISDAATDICVSSLQKTNVSKKDLAAVSGCVVFAPKGNDHEQILNLVLAPDRRDVAHGVVYMLGSFVGQVVPKLFVKHAKDLSQIKRELAAAYLEDLDQSKIYDMASIERFVSKDDMTAIKKQLKGGSVTPAFFDGLTFDSGKASEQAARLDQLLSMIFIHSFDSFYCRSHGAFDQDLANSIKAGKSSPKNMTRLVNTRKVLQVFFPRVYTAFTKHESTLRHIASSVGSGGFGLTGGEQMVRANLPEESAVAGPYTGESSVGFGLVDRNTTWGAFWGSISDNTGYTSYTNAVNRAATNIPADGNIVTNTARVLGGGLDQSTGYDNYRASVEKGAAGAATPLQAFGGGLKNGYVEQVYTPQYQQTERDYAMAQKYGSQTPGYDAVAISMGRHVGTTSAVEAATGWDISQDRGLSGEERVMKGTEATTKLAGNGAMVAGMMPSLRYMPITNPFSAAGEGSAAFTTLGTPMAADAKTMNALRSAGVDAKYLDSAASTFGEGAQMKIVGAEGKTVYRYYGGDSGRIGRYVVDAPIANPRQALALPGANPANQVAEMTLKPGTVYVEGAASSQVRNPLTNSSGGAMFGEHATGGASQMYLPQPHAELGRLFSPSGYTPTLTTGGAAAAQTAPAASTPTPSNN